MKKTIFAATVVAMTAGAALAQDVVRMGTEGAYPPYNFVNDAGQVDGFEIELGNELCKRAELTCTWVRNDWDSIIPNLVSGNYDTIMGAMSINDERKQTISFSDPYLPPAPSSYIALDEGADVNGIVAVQVNTVQAGYIAETDATLLEYTNLDEAVAAVRNGEADVGFGDHEVVRPFVEESSDLMFVGEQVFLDEGIAIGMRQSDTELRDKMNAAIASMKADGSLNEMIVKWFGADAGTFE